MGEVTRVSWDGHDRGPCATTYAGTGGRLGGRLLLVDHTAEDGSRHQDDVDKNGLHVELRLGVRDLLVGRRGLTSQRMVAVTRYERH